jgi:hypothetical protein
VDGFFGAIIFGKRRTNKKPTRLKAHRQQFQHLADIL